MVRGLHSSSLLDVWTWSHKAADPAKSERPDSDRELPASSAPRDFWLDCTCSVTEGASDPSKKINTSILFFFFFCFHFLNFFFSDWRAFCRLSSISFACKGDKPAGEMCKDIGCNKVTPLLRPRRRRQSSALCALHFSERYLPSERQKAGYVTGQGHLIPADSLPSKMLWH